MKVLVTGATGFIGSHLAKTLIDVGDEVVTIEHDSIPKTPSHILGVYDKMVRVRGDITDENLVKRIIGDYDIRMVYHCAALPIVKMGERSVRPIMEVNTMGTMAILEALRESNAYVDKDDPGTAFMMLSTDKVYGPVDYGHAYVETDPLNANAPYETSKACADQIARMYHAMHFVKHVVVYRPSNQYGPGDFLNFRIIPNVIRSCLQGKRPIMYRGMTYTREFTYVEDLMSAFMLARENLSACKNHKDGCTAMMSGEAYNVGCGHQTDQNGTINEILKHFPNIEPIMKEPESYSRIEIPYQLLDCSKFKALGWKAKWTFAQGIEATVKWWAEHPEIWEHKG